LQSDGCLNKNCGLAGVIFGTQATAQRRIELRNALLHKEKYKESSIVNHFPHLKNLNYNAQVMVYGEYMKALNNISKGKPNKFNLEIPSCTCEFFNKYYLPCKHIFYEEDVKPGFIQEQFWESFLQGWEESGYDVYWTRVSKFVPNEQSQTIDEAGAFRQVMERATELYYDMAGMSKSDLFMDICQDFIKSAEALKEEMMNLQGCSSNSKKMKRNVNRCF
jgi:hypothetical protein